MESSRTMMVASTPELDRSVRVDRPMRAHARRAAAGGRPLPLRARPWRVTALLLMSDFLALSLCTYGAVLLRWWLGGQYELSLYFKSWPLLALFPTVYACQRLYPSLPLSPAAELRKLTVSTSLVWLGLATLTFLLREDETFSRSVVLSSWAMSLAAVPLGRATLRALFAGRPWWGFPAVVLGPRRFAVHMVRSLRRQREVGLKPAAVLDLRAMEWRDSLGGVPILRHAERIEELARRHSVPVCIVPMSEVGRSLSTATMNRLMREFPHVIVVPEMKGFSSLWVDAVDLGGMLGLEVRNRLLHRGRRLLKRGLDLTLVALSLPVVLPLIGGIALAVRLDSPGPVIFRQSRIGYCGRRFTILKFRSMHRDADPRLANLLATDSELRDQWELRQKLPKDPRITRVGDWLRRMSLDELPQLFNVARGEMSLVGPRPIIDEEVPRYGEDYELFTEVYPGVTGLWQVSGRNRVSYQQRVAMDAFYVRNWSVWLDLYILSRTILAVVLRRGAM